MKHALFFLIGGLLTTTGCQTESEEASLIDYAQLPEIGVELVVEAGESDDYLPGQMWELVSISDGGFLVSDLQTTTIEQFSASGEHVATIAREGGGPGEMTPGFRLVPGLENDTIAVRHSFSGQFDYFAPVENGIYTYMNSVVPEQAEAETGGLTILGPFTGAEYFASRFSRVTASLTDEEINARYREEPVLLINEQGEVIEDSLYTLRLANDYLEVSRYEDGISSSSWVLPYRNRDRLLSLENGRYLIARPESGTITFYDNGHQPTNEIELKVAPRPVTVSDLDHHLDHVTSGSRRNAMEDRIPEFKPPFLDIWVSGNHILLLTDSQEEENEFAVYSHEGVPVGKFVLPSGHFMRRIRESRLYTIYRNPETGDQVRVYELDI